MNACFADTSWFLALLIREDERHHAAHLIADQLRRPIITSEYVVLEVINFLSAPSLRPKVSVFVHSLRGDAHTTVIPASTQLLDRSLDLFLARPDKSWSLTDCISFAIMREHGVVEALTADHHFEQAGFTSLLGSEV